MFEKVLYGLEITESFMMNESVLLFKENNEIYLLCIAKESNMYKILN